MSKEQTTGIYPSSSLPFFCTPRKATYAVAKPHTPPTASALSSWVGPWWALTRYLPKLGGHNDVTWFRYSSSLPVNGAVHSTHTHKHELTRWTHYSGFILKGWVCVASPRY